MTNSGAMRWVTFAMISLVCACPAPRPASGPGSVQGPDVAEFAALAWVPDRPTYLMTAHTVREAQRSIDDVIDSFGMLVGATADDAGHGLEQLLSVDPLSESGTTKLGIDPVGSIAMFSEGLDPTIVVRLASPETATGFFEGVKTRGVRTQAIVIDGVELVTATIFGNVRVSWAVDHDWLWAHFSFGLDKDPDARWFAHAHGRHATAWTKSFGWAKDLRAKLAAKASGLLGFFDTRALLAIARAHAPKDAIACLDRFHPIGLAGFAIDGDGHHAAGRLALELGPAAHGIASSLLPAPPGFAAIAAKAPIAVQWNLDVGAIAGFLAPCFTTFGGSTNFLTRFGIRTGRAAVLAFKPDDRSGSGVIAADLADRSFLASQLDQIPHRSLVESNHQYGALAGHRISIPFVISLDYVLNDKLGLLAMGDGLMDKLVMGAPDPDPPVFALDLIIPGLSPEAWKWLLRVATNEWFANRATEHLYHWHDGHLRVTIDHETLVIDAAGNRR